MIKTKYARMNREEKKELINSYKKTESGKIMMNRLFRLNIIGSLLIIYALYFYIKSFNNLKWTDFFVIVPLAISGLFFIIMSLKLKRKVLNNFAIKKK